MTDDKDYDNRRFTHPSVLRQDRLFETTFDQAIDAIDELEKALTRLSGIAVKPDRITRAQTHLRGIRTDMRATSKAQFLWAAGQILAPTPTTQPSK